MSLIQWTKLNLNHCNQLFLMFWLECDVDHCISGTNPVHCATQSFPMTGLRGVFKLTVYGLGTQLCTFVLLVQATERSTVELSSAEDIMAALERIEYILSQYIFNLIIQLTLFNFRLIYQPQDYIVLPRNSSRFLLSSLYQSK
jgi:hypothetical protein